MKKEIKRLLLAAGALAMATSLLTGCGSKKKNAEDAGVIKISTAPEPTVTPDPKTVDPDAVTSNGNLTMVNEYLAENGGKALGIDAATPTPASDEGTDVSDGENSGSEDTGDAGSDGGSDTGEDNADGE